MRNKAPHIFLVGFMGCGKSTVGPVLADKLGLPFIDNDQVIEARVASTIADLIAREGEPRFREIETESLRQAASSSGAVIALGGGAFTQEINRQIIAESGLSVWLDAPFELCWKRITEDTTVRPLAPNEETARARYASRLEIYKLADLHIAVDENQTAKEIAEMILSRR